MKHYFITYKPIYLVVTESSSTLLESKIGKRVRDAECKFEYFDQTKLKSVVLIMVGDSFKYHALYMANMISPKVGLTATQIER